MRLSRLKASKKARRVAKPARVRRVTKTGKKRVSSKASNWLHARARSVRHGHSARTMMIGITSGLLSTVLLGLWLSGHLGDAYGAGISYGENRLLSAGFGVEHIDIDGARFSSENEVRQVLGVEKGELVFAVNLKAARARVESLGWVRKASVTRLLPNRIAVVITERTPFAVWQNQQKFNLISAQGVVIRAADLTLYNALPLIVGVGADEEANKILSYIGASSAFNQKIRSVIRVSDRRWNIQFHSGSKLYLPATQWETVLDQLLGNPELLEMLEMPLLIVDGRVLGQFVVRRTPIKTGFAKRMIS